MSPVLLTNTFHRDINGHSVVLKWDIPNVLTSDVTHKALNGPRRDMLIVLIGELRPKLAVS